MTDNDIFLAFDMDRSVCRLDKPWHKMTKLTTDYITGVWHGRCRLSVSWINPDLDVAAQRQVVRHTSSWTIRPDTNRRSAKPPDVQQSYSLGFYIMFPCVLIFYMNKNICCSQKSNFFFNYFRFCIQPHLPITWSHPGMSDLYIQHNFCVALKHSGTI